MTVRRAVRRRPIAAVCHALEPRLVFSVHGASAYDQYMLELINRARANPSAEAARLGIALNEGLAAGTISTAAKQPLAMNENLADAALDHAIWLRVNGKFQHEGANGSTPTQRMIAAGYAANGSWGTGENLGMVSSSVLGDVSNRVETIYQNLFLDEGYAGRGHRLNILNGSFEEMGAGTATGDYRYNNANWKAVIAAQDFAYQSGNPWLVGVVYTDQLKTDNFYTPGEGMSGVTITARSSTGQTYSMTTKVAGGYSLQVPAGTYTVTATGTGGSATHSNVVVGSENVKRDFKKAQFSVQNNELPAPGTDGQARLVAGTLYVNGTTKRDTIEVVADADYITVTINGTTTPFGRALVQRVSVDAGRSSDLVTLVGPVPRATINGGAGSDSLFGGDLGDLIYGGDDDDSIRGGGGDDTVYAGAGNDSVNGNGGKNFLYGEDGHDRLNGGNGRDFLYGGAGNDRLYGNGGNDDLDGGGNNDRLYGGDGDDLLMGGNGIDRLYGDGGNDTLIGGRGVDYFHGGSGKRDRVTDREAIESILSIEFY